jgi:hypothetical protein
MNTYAVRLGRNPVAITDADAEKLLPVICALALITG